MSNIIKQFHILDFIIPERNKEFPCDNCIYDVIGCCNYPDTPEDYCVLGDKQIKRKLAED